MTTPYAALKQDVSLDKQRKSRRKLSKTGAPKVQYVLFLTKSS